MAPAAIVMALAAAPLVGQAQESLSAAEVGQIISQAAFEATALGAPATITVVDRVGNVLSVFRMKRRANDDHHHLGPRRNDRPRRAGASQRRARAAQPRGRRPGRHRQGGSPAAYLSSGGNAFTTRTASQIIQEHFNPRETFSPSGPLFRGAVHATPVLGLETSAFSTA